MALSRGPEGPHWSLDRKVNLSHITATVMIAAAFAAAWTTTREQVAVQGAVIAEIKDASRRQESYNALQNSQLRDDLKSLRDEQRSTNAKLDRLIEVLANPPANRR